MVKMNGDNRITLRKINRACVKFFQAIVEFVVRCMFKLLYGNNGPKMPPIKNLILLESASSIAFKIRTKRVTSVYVVKSFIERIEEINPLLNCVVANRFNEALKEAEAVDELIKSNTLSEEDLAANKPFLGVPFTTKDCIAVKGMIHTAGLYKRKDVIAEEDAHVIAALKNAGAILIGLTNISELCMWWESANTLHGRTNNPYDINRIVGGSSGGEGCIQAAAGSAFGIGSDIGGSVRMPAFFNGTFGHKASPNIIPLSGQYPSPATEKQKYMLSIGPIVRHAEDLLPLFKLIVLKDVMPLLRLDEKVDIKGIRFHYQENDSGSKLVSPVHKDIRELFRKISGYLEKAHNIKAQRVNLQRFRMSTAMWMLGMKSPNGPTFDQQLSNLEGSINVWWELFKWCFRCSNHTFIGLATALLEKKEASENDSKSEYIQKETNILRREIIDLLGDDGVLLYPTHPTPAPYHNEPIFKAFNFSYTGVINVLGFPATNIPMGLSSEGVPIGIQVIANDKNDRLCLAVAKEFEKAFGGWITPEIQA
ncbi:fatty-acid amide hydrolase 2 [Agrilus planipennis]|uniref:Fatty-acid amide hydrolase 2 n=1 Tax=Agrilus planipennis TaxID=224129 RepID=A0A1W4WUV8_AGRPL|nr:fatty-acid amide hydrolase 2 [Agrilus planipennis]